MTEDVGGEMEKNWKGKEQKKQKRKRENKIMTTIKCMIL
jgi:hypothetical protein